MSILFYLTYILNVILCLLCEQHRVPVDGLSHQHRDNPCYTATGEAAAAEIPEAVCCQADSPDVLGVADISAGAHIAEGNGIQGDGEHTPYEHKAQNGASAH